MFFLFANRDMLWHYCGVIMGVVASQITSPTIVYSTVYSDADQRKHQSSASLAFVWGIHRGPMNSPHKWPVTQKRFPFDDVIMEQLNLCDTIFHATPTVILEPRSDLDLHEDNPYIVFTGKLWGCISILHIFDWVIWHQLYYCDCLWNRHI